MNGGQEILIWILLVVGATTDLVWGKIHNTLTVPVFVLGIGMRASGSGIAGLSMAVTSVLVAGALFFPLYFLHTVAAGDVKLFMAFAAWSSFKSVIELGILSIVMGACVGAVVLFRQAGVRLAVKSVRDHWVSNPELDSHRMPFGPAFLCAFLFMNLMERHGWSLF